MKFEMKIKGILLLIILLILTSVLYYRITFNELNLTTGIILLSVVCVLLFLISETYMRVAKCSNNSRNNTRLLLIIISISLIGTELFLRFGLNRYSNYFEKNGSKNYQSLYECGRSSWFHIYSKNTDYKKPEFTYFRKVNSLGLCEKEIDQKKAENEYKIITLGDSFTEGVGTPYDSAWPRVVEKNLKRKYSNNITIINAGVSGSDPYFEYILLKEKLLSFHPDLVVVAINNSDINDVMMRGGMERFKADGTTVFSKKPPNWEWIYSISFICRHIIHDVFQYNWNFIKKNKMESEGRKAADKIKLAIYEFERLSKENNFNLLIVFHPHAYEVKDERYITSFNSMIYDLKNERYANLVDLLDYYRTNYLITKENASEFFWKLDFHHNTKGYEIMGDAIANAIVEKDFIN